MNILVFSSSFPPVNGGIELFVYHICKQLSIGKHHVRVVTRIADGDTVFDQLQKFEIHRCSYPPILSSLVTFGKIMSLCLRQKPNLLLFGHFGSTHLIGGIFAKKLLNIPYVILIHGSDINAYMHGFTWIDRFFSKIVLNNACRIIVNSAATKEIVSGNGYPSDKIDIVNPGADTKIFVPRNDNNKIKQELNIGDKKILLSVGRLVKRKGHAQVIKALPLVIKEIPDVIFVIIGKGPEEPYLKMLVHDMKLDEHVIFAGCVDEKIKLTYYQACDIFIMPSFEIKKGDMNDYEGFGIVYVEAHACGKPVIAGKTGGIEDAVIDGVDGILVDPEDISEIARAAISLLMDIQYAKKLGHNGRMKVEKKFDWDIVGKRIESVLLKTVCVKNIDCHEKTKV